MQGQKDMFQDPKQSNIAIFQSQVLEPGPMKVKSDQSKVQEEKDSTISMMSNNLEERKKQNSPSVTPEDQPKKKSKVKPKSAKNITQKQLSSQTQDSVTKEKDSKNFLLKSKITKSEELWLPTLTESFPSDLNLSKICSEHILSNSWFSVRKIRSKNSKEIQSNSSKKSQTVVRCKHYRLNLDKQTKNHIKETIDTTRYLYNQCVELYRNEGIKSLKVLRSRLLNSETFDLPQIMKETTLKIPYDLRDGALRDFVDALKATRKTMKEMHFRSKKVNQQSFSVPHKQLKFRDGKYTWFTKMWKGDVLKGFREQLPLSINHDCRIIVRKDGKIFISVPYDVEISERDGTTVVALDPGVRIFQTCYDNLGHGYYVGEDSNALRKSMEIAQRMRDGIMRNGKKGDSKQRKHLLKVANRVEQKIKNKISDIHRKLSKFLCKEYDKVIIPSFDTKQMVKKEKRVIGPQTAKSMIGWSHFAFKQLLRNKGEVTGSKIVVGTEEYTSKTCGKCGVMQDIGSSKTYECSCGYKAHRDMNGARNIMILND